MDDICCTICLCTKPASEFDQGMNPNGLPYRRKQCRLCRNQRRRKSNALRQRARRANNPEKTRADERTYRAKRKALGLPNNAWAKAHPEKMRAYVRASEERHREKVLARKRRHRADHLEVLRAKDRAYKQHERQTHLQKVKAREQRWRANNPEKYRVISTRARAKRNQSAIVDLSPEQWREVLQVKGYRCDYCGKKSKTLTMDHITPLSQQGDHTLWNIAVACKSCNSKKGARPPLKPVQPLLLTLAPKRTKKVG